MFTIGNTVYTEGTFVHDRSPGNDVALQLRYPEGAKFGAVATSRAFLFIILDKAQPAIAQCTSRAYFDAGGLGAVVACLLSGMPFAVLFYWLQGGPNVRRKWWWFCRIRFYGLR